MEAECGQLQSNLLQNGTVDFLRGTRTISMESRVPLLPDLIYRNDEAQFFGDDRERIAIPMYCHLTYQLLPRQSGGNELPFVKNMGPNSCQSLDGGAMELVRDKGGRAARLCFGAP